MQPGNLKQSHQSGAWDRSPRASACRSVYALWKTSQQKRTGQVCSVVQSLTQAWVPDLPVHSRPWVRSDVYFVEHCWDLTPFPHLNRLSRPGRQIVGTVFLKVLINCMTAQSSLDCIWHHLSMVSCRHPVLLLPDILHEENSLGKQRMNIKGTSVLDLTVIEYWSLTWRREGADRWVTADQPALLSQICRLTFMASTKPSAVERETREREQQTWYPRKMGWWIADLDNVRGQYPRSTGHLESSKEKELDSLSEFAEVRSCADILVLTQWDAFSHFSYPGSV